MWSTIKKIKFITFISELYAMPLRAVKSNNTQKQSQNVLIFGLRRKLMDFVNEHRLFSSLKISYQEIEAFLNFLKITIILDQF